LVAGDQLPSIRELAEELRVKQSVVRDALLKADTMGLVKVLPRAGVFLRGSIPGLRTDSPLEELVAGTLQRELVHAEENVLHLLDARRLVEMELVARAALHRRLEDLLPVRRALDAMLQHPADGLRSAYVRFDVRFHIEIARLAGNLALLAMQRSLMELLVPYLNQVPVSLQRRAQTDRSHIIIYEALVAGNAETAREEMRAHLSLAYDSLLRDLQQSPAMQ
jgi:DNA-binding FadR family transcriptional regulator